MISNEVNVCQICLVRSDLRMHLVIIWFSLDLLGLLLGVTWKSVIAALVWVKILEVNIQKSTVQQVSVDSGKVLFLYIFLSGVFNSLVMFELCPVYRALPCLSLHFDSLLYLEVKLPPLYSTIFLQIVPSYSHLPLTQRCTAGGMVFTTTLAFFFFLTSMEANRKLDPHRFVWM